MYLHVSDQVHDGQRQTVDMTIMQDETYRLTNVSYSRSYLDICCMGQKSMEKILKENKNNVSATTSVAYSKFL